MLETATRSQFSARSQAPAAASVGLCLLWIRVTRTCLSFHTLFSSLNCSFSIEKGYSAPVSHTKNANGAQVEEQLREETYLLEEAGALSGRSEVAVFVE